MEPVKKSVVVERQSKAIELSAIVSLEETLHCSIETLHPLHYSILKATLLLGHYRRHKSKLFNRVVHSQRFMTGLWNVLGLLRLQKSCDGIKHTLKKKKKGGGRRTIT